MALTAYATDHGGITMLNNNQYDIARKIILALKPVEEITKIITTSSACISANIEEISELSIATILDP